MKNVKNVKLASRFGVLCNCLSLVVLIWEIMSRQINKSRPYPRSGGGRGGCGLVGNGEGSVDIGRSEVSHLGRFSFLSFPSRAATMTQNGARHTTQNGKILQLFTGNIMTDGGRGGFLNTTMSKSNAEVKSL